MLCMCGVHAQQLLYSMWAQRPEKAALEKDADMHKCSGEACEINTCGKAKENKQNWAMETGRCGAVSCSQ